MQETPPNTPTNGPTTHYERDQETDIDTHTAIETLVASTATAVEASEQFSATDVFELLAHPGRRYVLTYLLRSDGEVTCEELADHVVDRTTHRLPDEEFRRQIVAELTHSHLPKLQEHGFVRYNRDRQIVAPTAQTPAVRPYLRIALAHQKIGDASGE